MTDLFACSGPGAGRAIAESIDTGYAHAAVAGGLLLVSVALSVVRGRWAYPAILFGLLTLHPAWTVSAIGGDCGRLKRDASLAFTGLACLALGWQLVRLLLSRNEGTAGKATEGVS